MIINNEKIETELNSTLKSISFDISDEDKNLIIEMIGSKFYENRCKKLKHL